ncbi:MAG: hypothetical protein NTV60_00075 [Candidatus Kaiserbacteria bacterium]|nr:hypothetical protein [Candidatus Kaiserbacteria bacterium]
MKIRRRTAHPHATQKKARKIMEDVIEDLKMKSASLAPPSQNEQAD